MGYAQEEQVVVFDEAPAVPDDHENGKRNADTEKLDNAVKKQVAVQSADVQTGKYREVAAYHKYSFWQSNSHMFQHPVNLSAFFGCRIISISSRAARITPHSKGNPHGKQSAIIQGPVPERGRKNC